MPSYCCFLCPTSDYSPKELTELCPTCGKPYGFPLTNSPVSVDRYQIVRALGRGFYAATYIAEYGPLRRKCVLKLTSKVLYDFFKKNFFEECQRHLEIADGTEHVVKMEDMLEGEVGILFGDTEIPCYVAQLQYVDGDLLKAYLTEPARLSAKAAAQIAIDLLRIYSEFDRKMVRHNDFHDENIIIERLSPDTRRPNAVDPSIRAVAIDLGSASDESKSIEGQRLNDLHWIGRHMELMASRLLEDPDATTDLDYRLASVLQDLGFRLSPDALKQRPASPGDLQLEIEDAFHRVSAPWSRPLRLRTFGDSYNAQTLSPWYVPRLLVP